VTLPVRRDWPLILAYHSVSDRRRDSLAVSPAAFERQIAWLARRGYRSTTLAALCAGAASPAERLAIVTFDDGYEDNYRLAVPILERHSFRATFFVVSDYVGSDRLLPADRRRVADGADPSPYGLLDWEQLRKMAASGFEIGSHSCTHPPALRALPRERCWEEVARSRADLERQLGRPVLSFCYPRGDLDEAVARLVEEAGYACAVVTPPRWGIPLGRFALRRMGVYRSNSQLAFRLKTTALVRRHFESLQRLRGRPR